MNIFNFCKVDDQKISWVGGDDKLCTIEMKEYEEALHSSFLECVKCLHEMQRLDHMIESNLLALASKVSVSRGDSSNIAAPMQFIFTCPFKEIPRSGVELTSRMNVSKINEKNGWISYKNGRIDVSEVACFERQFTFVSFRSIKHWSKKCKRWRIFQACWCWEGKVRCWFLGFKWWKGFQGR